MAIAGSSNENSIQSTLYVGLENFKVIGVNPSTPEEWKNLGFNFEKEPVYVEEKTQDGETFKQIRIDFILDNFPNSGEPHIKTIASYYVEKRFVESSTGKTQYTNNLGQFTWLEDPNNIPENMGWFSLKGARKAYRGEEFLMGFIRNFANVGKGEDCFLENPDKLFTGDISELKTVISAYPNNKIKMLLVVKNSDKKDEEGNIIGTNHYQSVYTRKTERPYSKDTTYLAKDIADWQMNGGGKNLEIPEDSFDLKEWVKVVPEEESEVESPW